MYSVYSNAQMRPVKIYGKLLAQEFCSVYIFWNFNRRQAMSPIAKFHHVVGRGFMIQRVIFIFIRYFLASQNKIFYVKV